MNLSKALQGSETSPCPPFSHCAIAGHPVATWLEVILTRAHNRAALSDRSEALMAKNLGTRSASIPSWWSLLGGYVEHLKGAGELADALEEAAALSGTRGDD